MVCPSAAVSSRNSGGSRPIAARGVQRNGVQVALQHAVARSGEEHLVPLAAATHDAGDNPSAGGEVSQQVPFVAPQLEVPEAAALARAQDPSIGEYSGGVVQVDPRVG